MSDRVARFVAELEREGIAHCHWKGRAALARGLRGERDLDFLVPPDSFARAESTLVAAGFVAARSRFASDEAGTAHFFAHEPGFERLLHVHLHDRVLTGEDLIASHTLPLARALLASPDRSDGVRVPTLAQETALTVLKHAIRWGSLPDRVAARLRPKDERAALAALLTEPNVAEAVDLLRRECPAVDAACFRACAASLAAGGFRPERVGLARRMRRALAPFANLRGLARWRAYALVGWARLRRLVDGDRRDKVLRGPGLRIAFTGDTAERRRARVAALGRLLGQAFAVRVVTAGRTLPSLAAGEIVLVDGAPEGWRVEHTLDLGALPDDETLRAGVWELL